MLQKLRLRKKKSFSYKKDRIYWAETLVDFYQKHLSITILCMLFTALYYLHSKK